MEPVRCVEPGDTPSSGTDGVDVDGRYPDLVTADGERVPSGQSSVENERHIETRAAHVDVYCVGIPERLRDVGPGHSSCAGTRKHGGDRPLLDGLDARDPSVGLHDPQPNRHSGTRQHILDHAEVRAHGRSYESIGHRCAGPLVLAHLRGDRARKRDLEAGIRGGEQLLDALFVVGEKEREEQANGDGLHFARSEPSRDLPNAILIEGGHHRATLVDPLRHFEPEVARNQTGGTRGLQLIQRPRFPGEPPNLEYVSETLCHDGRGAGPIQSRATAESPAQSGTRTARRRSAVASVSARYRPSRSKSSDRRTTTP